MNNCQQWAWFWEMGGNCDSIWLLLETEGAWFIIKSNLSTVLSTDYIFLCFLSHIRFYAHGFILPLLQSLGRNYGLITVWTGKWMWLTEPYPILGFSSCSWGDGGDLFQPFTCYGCLASVLGWSWGCDCETLLLILFRGGAAAGLDIQQCLASVSCCHYSSYKSLPKMKTWP